MFKCWSVSIAAVVFHHVHDSHLALGFSSTRCISCRPSVTFVRGQVSTLCYIVKENATEGWFPLLLSSVSIQLSQWRLMLERCLAARKTCTLSTICGDTGLRREFRMTPAIEKILSLLAVMDSTARQCWKPPVSFDLQGDHPSGRWCNGTAEFHIAGSTQLSHVSAVDPVSLFPLWNCWFCILMRHFHNIIIIISVTDITVNELE